MFAAVLPPTEVIESLDAYVHPRREHDPRLRWTRPDGWHLTTSFIADVPDVLRLEEYLAGAAAETQPFSLRIASGLAFPHPVAARILALGVSVGTEDLEALARKCRNAASRAGCAPDGARFIGHLTLARANRGIQATRWLGVLDSFPGWTFPVEEVALVQSHQVGREYEVVARFPLGVVAP